MGLTMIYVENPEVFLIAEPHVNVGEMVRYLTAVGGTAWSDRVLTDDLPAAEGLVEFMGRLCYRSWEPGLNRNVTKIREDRGEYLANVLRSGHGSVLEHAFFSFVIHNASRVLTAELNRHRAGTAISEQSLRYVRLDEALPFRLPPGLKVDTRRRMGMMVDRVTEAIAAFYRTEGIDSVETFHAKKEITSAIRRVAPMGMATEIGWSANVRTLRHVIEMRTAEGAEEEIRVFANQLGEIMKARCPLLFSDYERSNGAWITPWRKV